ncbi:MAG: MMPL family transporter [Bacteroidetes bacterium]|nr:MMPL family transporter [Bacteroidota bacterium]
MKIQKINNWFEKRTIGIIRKRWLIIALFIAIVSIGFNGLRSLKIESSWEDFFLEDDPVLVKSEEFKEIFGNDYFVAVLTECNNSFTKKSLELIRELSNELMDSLSYAEKISSLTDIEFMTGTEFGMRIEQIVPEIIPSDKQSLQKIKDKAYSKPEIAERLISKDGKFTWIILKLRTFPEVEIGSKESNSMTPDMLTGFEVEKIITKEKYKTISPRATGMPYVSYKKQNYFGKEAGKIMGMALLLAIIVLILATKSFRGVFVPLITSISSIVIVYGALGYMGYSIDSGMISIPILLSLAVAIAYNIHVFTFFKRNFFIHGKRKKAVIEAVSEMGWPILFSALTTMGALLTFLIIPMRPLRFVGFATASCVLITFVIVILLMPALLSFGKNRAPHPALKEKGGRWLDLKLGKLGNFVLAYPKSIIIVSVVIIGILIIGATKVESAFDIEKTMGRNIPYVDDLLDISESELGSLYSYDLLIEFNDDGAAKKPENLNKFEEVVAYAESFSLTKRTSSILNIIKDLNQTLNENNEVFYRVPANKRQVAQMLLLYENSGGTEAEYWIDYDYRRLRLMVEISTFNSGEAERELIDIQKMASVLFPEAQVTVVGNLPQFTTMMQYVVKGQVQSFAFALIVIMVLLMIVFGSIRTGLVGLIPNIAPAIAVGGVMGWFGIPLDMMTATIIPMILGLAVDDTIHFINHGQLEFNRTNSYDKSIIKTFKTVGVALVLSTIVISSNFLVYTTSTANQFINLGILAVIGMLAALVADLFITPILFKWFKIFGKEERING